MPKRKVIVIKKPINKMEDETSEIESEVSLVSKIQKNNHEISLKGLTLKNVKKFQTDISIDFSKIPSNMITLSGANGSGKTTILQSLMCCQTAFFYEMYKKDFKIDKNIEENAISNINKLITNKDSCITLSVEIDKQIATLKLSSSASNWQLEISDEDKNLYSLVWNLKNPKGIFIYIDSDKHIEEKPVTYDTITLNKKKEEQIILEYILDYQNFGSKLYTILTNEYIQYRLIPYTTPYDLYIKCARGIFTKLLSGFDMANFSSSTGYEFLLQVKNNESYKFDFRNLSSGEKSIFYICLLITYFTDIGLLIIDEPENHLHEDLLLKLHGFFLEFINSDFKDYITPLAVKFSRKEDTYAKKIDERYINYKLSKVIFSTHSKSLIYRNFGIGTNLCINRENKVFFMDENDIEIKLREMGLSSIYEKTLFVEGNTDSDFIKEYLEDKSVNIKPLQNCHAVQEMYENVLELKNYLHSTVIVFMMDKDTRDTELNELRNKDPDFFDSHFVLLDRLEFENYFLDEALLFDVVQDLNDDHNPNLSLEWVKKCLKENADKTKNQVLGKIHNEELRHIISNLQTKIDTRKLSQIDLSNDEDFNVFSNKLIDELSVNELHSKFLKCHNSIKEQYLSWDTEYLKLCDGKSAFNQLASSSFVREIGIEKKFLFRRIKTLIEKDLSSDRKYAISQLLVRLNNLLK